VHLAVDMLNHAIRENMTQALLLTGDLDFKPVLKASGDSDYKNHFNSKLNKCFVLVSDYSLNDDFRTLDLYDAAEGKRYATYHGHNVCEVAITKNSKRCALDSGSIWFDGNDSRNPPDFRVGFRGLLYGGGAGDENTQKTFLDQIQAFMT